eukprot:sb/3471443/
MYNRLSFSLSTPNKSFYLLLLPPPLRRAWPALKSGCFVSAEKTFFRARAKPKRLSGSAVRAVLVNQLFCFFQPIDGNSEWFPSWFEVVPVRGVTLICLQQLASRVTPRRVPPNYHNDFPAHPILYSLAGTDRNVTGYHPIRDQYLPVYHCFRLQRSRRESEETTNFSEAVHQSSNEDTPSSTEM